MKFVLAMIICSQVAGSCLDPYKVPEKFDEGYDCMVRGYEMSLDKIKEIGREDVNKYNMYIRFGCYPESQPEGQPTKFDTVVKLW
jgi:hypothetical protein